MLIRLAAYDHPDDLEFVKVADSDSADYSHDSIEVPKTRLHVDIFQLCDGEEELGVNLATENQEGESKEKAIPARVMSLPNRRWVNAWKRYDSCFPSPPTYIRLTI